MVARLSKSMLGLIVVAFLLVSLPLIAAVLVSYANVNQLSREADRGLKRAAQIAQLSKTLDQEILGMERYARQYAALVDEEYLALYDRRQLKLELAIDELRRLVRDAVGRDQLGFLLAKSQEIRGELLEPGKKPPMGEEALAGFELLEGALNDWMARSNRLISEESLRLQHAAAETRSLLTRLLITTIPAAVLMIMLFTFLIAQPLRQLSRAIRGLGLGGLDRPIRVRGPADLEALGYDLDALRRRLLATEQDKQQFLRHMSHELKTPLASLLEGTELFTDGSLGELVDAQSEVAAILRSNAQELRHLIENLLDYAAWQESGAKLNRSEFEFQVLCQQVLEQYRLAIMAKNLNLEQRIIPMRVSADREKLRTVLTNLISNAVKYSPAGSSVHMRALSLGGKLVFDIADAGPNVPESERARIFEPFFTGTPPRDSHLRGSGIGLSLVREYVHAHGGEIELVDGQYRGAHFRVTLPVSAARAQAGQTAPRERKVEQAGTERDAKDRRRAQAAL